MNTPPGERLDSWKAIADYLGRDRTTVMRWERTAGLPVRRVPGARRGSVFAYRDDIDAWLAREGQPDNRGAAASTGRHTRAAAVLAAALFIAAGVIGRGLWAPSSDLAQAALAGEELVATDASGREAWRYRLPHIDGNIVVPRTVVTDVTGDGRQDVLSAVHFMARGGHGYGSILLLDHRGRLLWERRLDDRYRFGASEYGPAWFPEDIVVFRRGSETRIAVAQHHHTWWPGVVVTYDERGQPRHRFVHAGWIRSLNVTTDGRYLLAAGISNSFGGAALAVLDAAKPEGTSPSAGGSLPSCANCPGGAPVAYFVAPWTELARPSDTPQAVVNVTRPGAIEWRAVQRGVVNGKVPEVIVNISSDLRHVRSNVNDFFTESMKGLARPIALPSVSRWTPGAGWRPAAAD